MRYDHFFSHVLILFVFLSLGLGGVEGVLGSLVRATHSPTLSLSSSLTDFGLDRSSCPRLTIRSVPRSIRTTTASH